MSLVRTMGACLVLGAVAPAAGENLLIGDAAPSLDIAHWMSGEPVASFEPGRVYALEFWATWCKPCIANMDHLSRVQELYGDRVIVIGLSDEPLQTTVRFLTSRYGPDRRPQRDRIKYALATDPDRSVHRAYLDAAAIGAIPTVFIIGKDGRIEWVGHPKDMDVVLDAVLEDRWDAATARARMRERMAASRPFREATGRLSSALTEARWDDAVEALDVIIADGHDTYIPTKFLVLVSRFDRQRAYAYGRQIMEQAWDDNPWLLHHLAWTACGGDRAVDDAELPVPDENRDLDFALKTARRAVEIDDTKDEMYVSMLARVHAARGEYAEAAEQQARALERLEAVRPLVSEGQLDGFEAGLEELRRTLADYASRARAGKS